MRNRRGNYLVIYAFVMTALIGMVALVVDVSWIRMGEDQIQDMANAAALAAIVELRDSDPYDEAAAEAAAEFIVDKNRVGGDLGARALVEFGEWDWGVPRASAFSTDYTGQASAVRVSVWRDDEATQGELVLWLAPAVYSDETEGVKSVELFGSAVAAYRPRDISIALDLGRSWKEELPVEVKADVRGFLAAMRDRQVLTDQVGMVHFTGTGEEFTALQDLAINYTTIDASWDNIDWCDKSYEAWENYHRFYGQQFEVDGYECWDKNQNETEDLDEEDVNGDAVADQLDCKDGYNVMQWSTTYRDARIDAHSLADTTPEVPEAGDPERNCTDNGGYQEECGQVASWLDWEETHHHDTTEEDDGPMVACHAGSWYADTDEWADPDNDCIDDVETTYEWVQGCPKPGWWDAGTNHEKGIDAAVNQLTGAGSNPQAMPTLVVITDHAPECYNVDEHSSPNWSRNEEPPFQLPGVWNDPDIDPKCN
ncbi:MAG: hypothetical protein HN348_00635, partial [Proteobacteria bacterium]|nr:hypothetical protein [Pseudomonadota bacterium]